MVRELHGLLGAKLPAVLGIPVRTVELWRSGRCMPGISVRLVWLLWALLLHPERCATVADLITWGRFAALPSSGAPVSPADSGASVPPSSLPAVPAKRARVRARGARPKAGPGAAPTAGQAGPGAQP